MMADLTDADVQINRVVAGTGLAGIQTAAERKEAALDSGQPPLQSADVSDWWAMPPVPARDQESVDPSTAATAAVASASAVTTGGQPSHPIPPPPIVQGSGPVAGAAAAAGSPDVSKWPIATGTIVPKEFVAYFLAMYEREWIDMSEVVISTDVCPTMTVDLRNPCVQSVTLLKQRVLTVTITHLAPPLDADQYTLIAIGSALLSGWTVWYLPVLLSLLSLAIALYQLHHRRQQRLLWSMPSMLLPISLIAFAVLGLWSAPAIGVSVCLWYLSAWALSVRGTTVVQYVPCVLSFVSNVIDKHPVNQALVATSIASVVRQNVAQLAIPSGLFEKCVLGTRLIAESWIFQNFHFRSDALCHY